MPRWGLEHALFWRTHSAAFGLAFAIVRRQVAGLVLLARATPAAVIATENRDCLLLGSEYQSFEAFTKIHAIHPPRLKKAARNSKNSIKSVLFGQSAFESAS